MRKGFWQEIEKITQSLQGSTFVNFGAGQGRQVSLNRRLGEEDEEDEEKNSDAAKLRAARQASSMGVTDAEMAEIDALVSSIKRQADEEESDSDSEGDEEEGEGDQRTRVDVVPAPGTQRSVGSGGSGRGRGFGKRGRGTGTGSSFPAPTGQGLDLTAALRGGGKGSRGR